MLKVLVLLLVGATSVCAAEATGIPDRQNGWTTATSREELRPAFRYESLSDSGERLIVQHDNRPGLDGWWSKTFPVQGGQTVRFSCLRKTENVAVPRRSVV